MKTYTLRSGEIVTSKDGAWPTQYTNRTQADRAAAKIPGATVVQRGRPFYVALPPAALQAPASLRDDLPAEIVNPVTGLTHERRADGGYESTDEIKARMASDVVAANQRWDASRSPDQRARAADQAAGQAGEPKTCPHGKGFNCPTCWPTGSGRLDAQLVGATYAGTGDPVVLAPQLPLTRRRLRAALERIVQAARDAKALDATTDAGFVGIGELLTAIEDEIASARDLSADVRSGS